MYWSFIEFTDYFGLSNFILMVIGLMEICLLAHLVDKIFSIGLHAQEIIQFTNRFFLWFHEL